jgi:hypothetical protein
VGRHIADLASLGRNILVWAELGLSWPGLSVFWASAWAGTLALLQIWLGQRGGRLG